jgi:polyisoprenoid-binding protein YceI
LFEQPTRTRLRSLIAVAGAGLIVAACGPNTTPSSATNPPTSAPAATSAAGSSQSSVSQTPTAVPPTAVARPTQPTETLSQSTTPAANGQSTSATAASSSANTNDAVKLVLDQSNSQARYHAHEQLVGRSLPTEAVGTTTSVKGTLVIGADGSVNADQSQIQVDLSQLKSDESRRDNFIKGDTLQTNRFPMATFVPRDVQGLPTPLPTSGEATFQLAGDLTVHGVTKPVTWQVTAQFSDGGVSGNATTNVNISDFGMTPPKAGPVLSIQDGLTLEMVFTANREA